MSSPRRLSRNTLEFLTQSWMVCLLSHAPPPFFVQHDYSLTVSCRWHLSSWTTSAPDTRQKQSAHPWLDAFWRLPCFWLGILPLRDPWVISCWDLRRFRFVVSHVIQAWLFDWCPMEDCERYVCDNWCHAGTFTPIQDPPLLLQGAKTVDTSKLDGGTVRSRCLWCLGRRSTSACNIDLQGPVWLCSIPRIQQQGWTHLVKSYVCAMGIQAGGMFTWCCLSDHFLYLVV